MSLDRFFGRVGFNRAPVEGLPEASATDITVDTCAAQLTAVSGAGGSAHEALCEAGRAIDRSVELLKIQVNGTLATQQGNSAQIYYTEVSPMDAGRCEPACQPPGECS